MIRTGIKGSEKSRVLWVSAAAQAEWEPTVRAVSKYVMEMERAMCLKGRVAVQYVSQEELIEVQKWATINDLIVSILEVKDGTTRVAITPHSATLPFHKAWTAGDQDEIGNRLGYPRCCVRFFKDVWENQKYMDTTWPMAVNTSSPCIDNIVHIGADTPWQANILMRWMGIRGVFHLPCSFACWRTVMHSDAQLDEGRDEYAWLIEMLGWPMEWSALHGIARIKTPIFEISASTDHSDKKYTVQRDGISYPKEGARGLVFPFRSGAEQEGSLWKDNGFKSHGGMEAGHRVVVSAIPEIPKFTSVWDLGCGNGLLLSKIGKKLGIINLVGVDLMDYFPRKYIGSFIKGDIRQAFPTEADQPALAIISENRLKEIPELGKILRGYSGYVVYSYEQMKASYTPTLRELK